jgi:hypothetical protein
VTIPTPDVLADVAAEVNADSFSLGLVLHGSRAIGVERPDSDYDLIRVVTEQAYDARKAAGTLLEHVTLQAGPKADVLYQSPGRLRWIADNPDWWTATYISARVIVDKAGDVEELVRRIVERADAAAAERVAEAYDAYLNSFVRSLKAWRGGDDLGDRLHAAHSTQYLLQSLFGLERRWLPYFDALKASLPEIERAQGWDPGFLRTAILELLHSGDPAFQQELERRVEDLMSSRGVRHEWGSDLEPLKALRFGSERGDPV